MEKKQLEHQKVFQILSYLKQQLEPYLKRSVPALLDANAQRYLPLGLVVHFQSTYHFCKRRKQKGKIKVIITAVG